MDLQEIEKQLNKLNDEVQKHKNHQEKEVNALLAEKVTKLIAENLSALGIPTDAFSKMTDNTTNQQPPKYKRWRADAWGNYYTVNLQGDIIGIEEDYCLEDDYLYRTGNYHHANEQAIRYRDTQILRQELKDFAEGYEFRFRSNNWSIGVNERGDYVTLCGIYTKEDKQYFPTEQKLKEAIKHFGARLDLIYKPKEVE